MHNFETRGLQCLVIYNFDIVSADVTLQWFINGCIVFIWTFYAVELSDRENAGTDFSIDEIQKDKHKTGGMVTALHLFVNNPWPQHLSKFNWRVRGLHIIVWEHMYTYAYICIVALLQ